MIEWELLLIDNASQNPLQNLVDLSWHPIARIIHEPALALSPEAEGEIIIFVDDGNVLDPSYLSESMRIACNFPAWVRGAGNSFRNLKSHLLRDWKTCLGLALRKLPQGRWSSYDSSTSPNGAGLCVRASVAGRDAKTAVSDLMRRSLDRREGSLIGGGDLDLAMTSYQLWVPVFFPSSNCSI